MVKGLHALVVFVTVSLAGVAGLSAQAPVESDTLPVRGFAIVLPSQEDVADLIGFVDTVLAPGGVNTLLLRVDFKFQYESHPELRDDDALGRDDVKRITEACRRHGIRVIPQINLLGHQSWHGKVGKLLEVYPEFDETPAVVLPDEWRWPNDDGLYCKSYCPRHPKVHEVVFALVDEVIETFGANAFHAGMDEVFFLGDDDCPRCRGLDPAELYAAEVTRVRNHLAKSGVELWIWGDRLLDGATTGLGMWEASMNRTHRAVDLIPKDVVIGDWHYERADPTAPYFAMKGFRVVSCPWNRAEVARNQVEDMRRYRQRSTPEMRDRFLGVMQTVWSDTRTFLDLWADAAEPEDGEEGEQVECTRAFLGAIREQVGSGVPEDGSTSENRSGIEGQNAKAQRAQSWR